MKLRIIPETFDMLPPGLLDQLQSALVATGNLYGFKLKTEVDQDGDFNASQRFWDWHMERQRGTEGG